MKGMPLPFEFEGTGVDLELAFNNSNIRDNSSWWGSNNLNGNCVLNSSGEPTSVLDIARSPSSAISSSTLSSSLGNGGGGGIAGGGASSTDTAGVAAVSGNNQKSPSLKRQQDSTTATSSNAGVVSQLLPVHPSLEIGTVATAASGSTAGKCAMDEWESVLSESAVASPSHEQSILRLIMGDVDDPEMGSLNKVLQIGTAPPPPTVEFEFNGGFGVVDQAFGTDPVAQFGSNFMHNSSSPSKSSNNEKIGLFSNSSSNHSNNSKFPSSQNNMFSSVSGNLGPITTTFDSTEMKAPIFTAQTLMNQHQTQYPQNQTFFFPSSYANQNEQNLFMPPQAKRHNPGTAREGLEPGSQIPKGPFSVPGKELLMGKQVQHQQPMSYQLQLLLQQRPPSAMGPGPKTKMGEDDLAYCHLQQQQQAIIDQLYKATELVQIGDPILAQEILARLNHQVSPIGKPFQRAAFYCKEALQLTIHNNNIMVPSTASASPFNLIFKIGAYKSFSEISPLVQFANFTCNQALLEVVGGFDRIHVVDFDIGYGGQWASLMQELALRREGAPALKITAFMCPSTHDQLELSLTRENLIHFANEINVVLEFEVMSIESLNSGSWSLPFQVSENEAIAVNLPVGSLASYQLSIPLVLRFVKHLSPKIVVSVDRGCDRIDLPFPNHIIHALQSYSNLLESLDAVNLNIDALQKIERLLLQPGIEKIVMRRFRAPEKTQHWRTLFLSSGFSPVTFSNFTESQADCVVKRTPVQGFNIEKRQSSLVLCWQRKDLISASAWRC